MDVRPKMISTLAHAVFIYISELTPVYLLTYLHTNYSYTTRFYIFHKSMFQAQPKIFANKNKNKSFL